MEIPLLGQGKTEETPVREVEFALLLIKSTDGQVTLSTDISTPIMAERLPIPDEVISSLSSALKNMEAQQVAAIVMQGMMQMSQMAMQAQQNQGLISKLDLHK